MATKPDRIIGIAGGSCTGKTELEKGLQARFGDDISIFPFDDIFVGVENLRGREIDDWESPELYRWPDFRGSLLELSSGYPVSIRARSRESKSQGLERRLIEPNKFVVVAGFLALHDEASRRYYSSTVFIDLPEAEMLRRRKARPRTEDPWDTDEYIDNHLVPGHRAYVLPQLDFAEHVIDGTKSQEVIVDEVSDIIIGRVD